MIVKRKDEFGSYEMLTICVVLLIIFVLLLAHVFKTDYKEQYKVMQYNAKMFSLSVSNLYLDDQDHSVYYLQSMIDDNSLSNIKNPFQGDKYCNTHTSMVVVKNNKKYVTLECGSYLIYQQDSLKTPYTIYQASPWSKKEHKNDNQSMDFYNYQDGREKLFEEDLELELFLYEYNKLNNTFYKNVKEIPDQGNIVKTTMYRHMEKVSD